MCSRWLNFVPMNELNEWKTVHLINSRAMLFTRMMCSQSHQTLILCDLIRIVWFTSHSKWHNICVSLTPTQANSVGSLVVRVLERAFIIRNVGIHYWHFLFRFRFYEYITLFSKCLSFSANSSYISVPVSVCYNLELFFAQWLSACFDQCKHLCPYRDTHLLSTEQRSAVPLRNEEICANTVNRSRSPKIHSLSSNHWPRIN